MVRFGESEFMIQKGSGGTQLSLTDRYFNACDETCSQFAVYTLKLAPGVKIGSKTLKAEQWYTMKLKWNGVNANGKNYCSIYFNGSKKASARIKLQNPSPNGISYLHLISTASKADNGILIEQTKARVR